MSGWKKLASAAAASGEVTNVESVFSTHLYTGTNSAQTITNGIDLAGEGGLVWMKNRTTATIGDHALFDSETVTGSTFPVVQKAWVSNDAGVLDGYQPGFTFTSTGFTTAGRSDTDQSGVDYVTWSFRKCPKFFDVVNYTGNSTSGRTISHNLGVVPAMIIVMGQSTGDFWVYHKDVGNTKYLELNKTSAAQTSSSAWNNTTPTDSVFTVGDGVPVNYSGQQYTAFIFAHNDGDGDFGLDGDADIIKCASYTGNGSTDGPEINLGFEPQWIIFKDTSATGDWQIMDVMRGLAVNGDDKVLQPNTTSTEITYTGGKVNITPTGFQLKGSGAVNNSGRNYIYIAIRRGPMAVPESATDVFDMDFLGATSPNPPAYNSSGWPVDMGIQGAVGAVNSNANSARLIQGKFLKTDSPDAETTSSQYAFDFQDGWRDSTAVSNDYLGYMWRRAPNFFDVVAYEGTGSNQTIDHNLGIAPEMMWVKARSRNAQWIYYHSAIGNTGAMWINDIGDGVITDSTYWNNTSPSSTNFSLGNNYRVNQSGQDYIAYLFASVDGISKVGSYTGDGTDGRTIDCGFSSGARFVLIKDTAANTPFQVYDSERGIVSGNDPLLQLNSTAAEVTSFDFLDPDSSGFQVNSTINYVNQSGRTYTFYAIA